MGGRAERDLVEWLREPDATPEPLVDGLLARLAGVVGESRVLALSIDPTESGYAIGMWRDVGFDGPLRPLVAPHVEGKRVPWALYDPLRPEPSQRNKVVQVCTNDDGEIAIGTASRAFSPSAVAEKLLDRFGVRYQLRALVCDGPVLLAWVGAMSDRPFSPEHEAALARILRPVRARLRAERELGVASLSMAAIGPALDAISSSAFVLDDVGRVRFANAAGARALERPSDGKALRERLARVAKRAGTEPEIAATWFSPRGMGDHCLLVLRRREEEVAVRIARARQRWGLTARQAEVLEHVANGRANKTIASLIGCAERTVEVHVAVLLERAAVEGRAGLVARFWTL